MKLIILMYLAEDERCVGRLLSERKVSAFSRLSVEGHGPGFPVGWYGETAPYHSQLIMTMLPDDDARALLRAVSECTDVQDPRHPIRAAALGLEEFVPRQE